MLALAFTWSKPLEALMMPLLVSLNMIPKVALGPLIIVWFKYGIVPNMLIAFSICVFPILLTTVRGLREVEPDLLDLVKSLRGSRWQTFTKIQLPGGLPDAAGAGDARHGGDVHGGDPDHPDRHAALRSRLAPRTRTGRSRCAGVLR
jgi:ABC-type nitrate/sulfonate/bicarbonate transport system permease component